MDIKKLNERLDKILNEANAFELIKSECKTFYSKLKDFTEFYNDEPIERQYQVSKQLAKQANEFANKINELINAEGSAELNMQALNISVNNIQKVLINSGFKGTIKDTEKDNETRLWVKYGIFHIERETHANLDVNVRIEQSGQGDIIATMDSYGPDKCTVEQAYSVFNEFEAEGLVAKFKAKFNQTYSYDKI